MKIVVFELEDWERDAFNELKKHHNVVLSDQKATGELLTEHSDADIISPFVYSKLDSEALGRFDDLKLVTTRSTGFDHVDIDYCRKHDIAVANVPTYADETVAEHVFALLLAISHNVVEAVKRTREGSFSQEGLEGFDLRGKTLGVIGTGGIGINVIKIAGGFRMKVLAFDVKPDEDAASELDYSYVEMDELLSKSDVVTLHVPGNEKTRNLISKDEISKMKKEAVLINTSRGFVVDIRALAEALVDEKIAAAGLDVLPEEPSIREEAELIRAAFTEEHDLEAMLAGHMLSHRRNVLVTPHSAFNTREAKERLLQTTIDNIASFIDGSPRNLVDGSGGK
jgi:D-lactate dehydrogenase